MKHLTEEEFQAVTRQLDALVQEFERLPFPQVREMVFDLLQAVDTLHREGLGRLVGFLHSQGQADLVDRAANDPIIHTLLLLYDLIPGDELEPPVPMANFIPLDQVGFVPQRPLRRPVFKEVARLEEVPAGTMKDFEVDGVRVLVVNVAGEIYAMRDHCPGSMAPLHLGTLHLSPPILICPWHNEAFDIPTGKRIDGQPGPDLNILPVALTDGVIRVIVDTPSNGQVRVGRAGS